MALMKKRYTTEEDEYLMSHQDYTAEHQGKHLGRSASSVTARKFKLGLVKPFYHPHKKDQYGLLTADAVYRQHPEYKKIIRAVVARLGGKSYICDINRHGIQGGYAGFTYYRDTLKFAYAYRRHILNMLEDDAEEFGIEIVEMVKNFGYFKRNGKMDSDDTRDLYRYLSLTKCKETCIPNLMAWYAAETVCRWFEED